MSTPDGGAAFPSLEEVDIYKDDRYESQFVPVGGMTLRDYFAAQALPKVYQLVYEHNWTLRNCAERAYQLADVMLAEREKRG